MTDKEIDKAIEAVMGVVRKSDAFNPDLASKSESRSYIKGIIEACELELEGLGGDDE